MHIQLPNHDLCLDSAIEVKQKKTYTTSNVVLDAQQLYIATFNNKRNKFNVTG